MDQHRGEAQSGALGTVSARGKKKTVRGRVLYRAALGSSSKRKGEKGSGGGEGGVLARARACVGRRAEARLACGAAHHSAVALPFRLRSQPERNSSNCMAMATLASRAAAERRRR